MFSFLKKPEPINVSSVGLFHFENIDWSSKVSIEDKTVFLYLSGSKKEISQFAINYWLDIRDSIPHLWREAIIFTLLRLNELGEYSFTSKDFQLEMINIHNKNSFDGGHLSFWFDINGDENGSHYVSFIDEKPNYWHRDS